MRARLDEVGRVLAADGGARVGSATAQLRAVERALDRADGHVAEAGAARERADALEAMEALLRAEEERLRLDAAGAREVDGLVRSARQALHEPRRFDQIHADLADRAQRHLGVVEDNRRARDAVELEVTLAVEAFDVVLAEAAEAQTVLPGQDRAEQTRQRLIADLAAGTVASARRGAAALTAAVAEFETSLEEVLDSLYHCELVVEAAAEALPSVGLQVLAGSVVQTGSVVAFQVARSDGAVLDLTVESVGEGARVTYDGHASDYVQTRTAEGTVAVCDLTEELLERFHDQLSVHDVEAGELQWEGKPARPDRRGAQRHIGYAGESRGRD